MGLDNHEGDRAPVAPGPTEEPKQGRRADLGRLRVLWPNVLASTALGVAATFMALSLGAADPLALDPARSAGSAASLTSQAPSSSPDLSGQGELAFAASLAEDEEGPGLQADPSPTATTGLASLPSASTPAATGWTDSILNPDVRPRLSDRTGTRPAEGPTPTPTPKPRREIETYKVTEGDTVSGIADRFDISVETVVRANNLANPDGLEPGQELVILPVSGQLHVVRAGDTVLDLASQYGVIPEDIISVNKLADPNALQIDQKLLIPEAPEGIREAGPAEPSPLDRPLAPIKYQVAPGDTLSGIAAKHGISTGSVLVANPGISNPEQLKVGQALLLPPVSGLIHTVVAGDTVSGVAARYNASAAEIIRVNALKDPYLVSLGQTLIVPGGTIQAAVAARRPAPASAPRPGAAPPAAQAAPAPAPAVAGSGSGPGAANVALRYVGSRYVFGGSAPGGFDCSGLTSYAYRQAGRPIPRDLWGQLNSGPRVSRANLQVGDLVFFQNTYTAGLSHVGIYVGGGRFVHAGSEHTGVLVTNLSDPYWNARYLGASRP